MSRCHRHISLLILCFAVIAAQSSSTGSDVELVSDPFQSFDDETNTRPVADLFSPDASSIDYNNVTSSTVSLLTKDNWISPATQTEKQNGATDEIGASPTSGDAVSGNTEDTSKSVAGNDVNASGTMETATNFPVSSATNQDSSSSNETSELMPPQAHSSTTLTTEHLITTSTPTESSMAETSPTDSTNPSLPDNETPPVTSSEVTDITSSSDFTTDEVVTSATSTESSDGGGIPDTTTLTSRNGQIPDDDDGSSTTIKQSSVAALNIVLIVLMFAIVCIAVGIFVAYFKESCSSYFGLHRSKSRNSVPREVVTCPPVVRNHAVLLDQLQSIDLNSLAAEYEELTTLATTSFKYPQTDAALAINRDKNRYINIHPFDYNRVVLPTLPNDPHSNYINASYVKGFSHKKEFIAAQGPKPNTTPCFWRMIWDNNVNIIAMVTNLMEDNTPKCDKYWPDLNASVEYGNIKIHTKEENLKTHFIERHLEVIQDGVLRHIKHFHFIDWPDFGCPHNPQDLITFVQAVRQEADESYCNSPIIVHCSAGVGRTGTFIAVDWLLQQVKTCNKIDVFKVVADLRRCRVLMVQKVDQYKFIYKCLSHYVSPQSKAGNRSTQGRASTMALNHSRNTLAVSTVNELATTTVAQRTRNSTNPRKSKVTETSL